MAKPKIIREWIELSEGMLEDGPPKAKQYEAVLFVNRCEVRETAKGRYLRRRTGCEFLYAPTQDDLCRKAQAFAMREDVRRLVKGIDANDFDTLPSRVDDPPEDIVEGTADIYATAEDSNV